MLRIGDFLAKSNWWIFVAVAFIIAFLAMALILGVVIGMGIMYLSIQGNGHPEISPIMPLTGPVAINASSDRNIAYICSPDGELHVVDTGSGSTIAVVPFDKTQGVAIPSKDRKEIYVTNGGNLSVISSNGYRTIKTLSFNASLGRIALTPDGSRLYLEESLSDNSSVAVIDTSSDSVIDIINVMQSSWGEGMAFSPDGKYLYLTDYWNCELVVIDTGKNAILKTIRCGGPESFRYQETFAGHNYWNGGVACDIAVSPDGHWVYVSLWSSSDLAIIDARNLSLEKTVRMGARSSNSVTISPDGKYVYASNNDILNQNGQIVANSITILSAPDGTIMGTILISTDTKNMRITPDGKYIYVCSGSDDVQIISTETRTVVGKLGFIGTHIEFGA